jgi:hypothetical protein
LVQALLGHSTITMTMRYAHLAPGDGAEAIRALDAMGTAQGSRKAADANSAAKEAVS